MRRASRAEYLVWLFLYVLCDTRHRQGDGQIIQHDGWAAAKLMLLYNYGPLSTHSASDSHHLPVSKCIIYIWHVYGIKEDESEYVWTLGLQDDAFGRESKFFKGKKKLVGFYQRELT